MVPTAVTWSKHEGTDEIFTEGLLNTELAKMFGAENVIRHCWRRGVLQSGRMFG